ncbi:MAG TPA: hypothetical protein VGQ85_08770 [Candidatus Limnocylindrales bacterium]|nr:hypothetical protein [Candidatus Limnocylindrales bacterium]
MPVSPDPRFREPGPATGTAARRRDLNRRLRVAFIAGSEERWLADHGRPMTAEELRRVLRRYPGDLPER